MMSLAEIYILLYATSFVIGFLMVRLEHTSEGSNAEWIDFVLVLLPAINLIYAIFLFVDWTNRRPNSENFWNRIFLIKHK